MRFANCIQMLVAGAAVWVVILGGAITTNAQKVTIEGRVQLTNISRSAVNMGSGFGGYQSHAGNSSSTQTSEKSPPVLLWLESEQVKTRNQAGPDSIPVLDQRNKEFQPKLMAVRKGGEVRIRNSDPIYHNVFSLSPTKRFDVGRRPPGEYVEVTFKETGTVDVFCDIHSDMHAVIRVLPKHTLQWKRLREPGMFRFEQLPRGRYVLHLLTLGNHHASMKIDARHKSQVSLGTITVGS